MPVTQEKRRPSAAAAAIAAAAAAAAAIWLGWVALHLSNKSDRATRGAPSGGTLEGGGAPNKAQKGAPGGPISSPLLRGRGAPGAPRSLAACGGGDEASEK